MRILHIEDDKLIQAAMLRMLRISYSAEIVTVDNPVTAIGALLAANAGTPFDLVISDWDIVGGTGGDVFDWMLANVPDMKARWMFLTSRDEACHLGVPCLVKPTANADIRDCLDQLVTGCASKGVGSGSRR